MCVTSQIDKFRPRSPKSVQPAIRKRWKLGIDTNKLLRVRVGQRLKQHGVYHREDPRGGANPQHQAEHRRRRESQILPHHSQCELDVLPQCSHGDPPLEVCTLEISLSSRLLKLTKLLAIPARICFQRVPLSECRSLSRG